MAETITLRWWGPADATSGSRYRVERTTDGQTWTELAAAQAATQISGSYVSPKATLAVDVDADDTDLPFVDASALAASGYMWLGGCLVQWTSKLSNTIKGCTWHSGYGVVRAGTVGHQAHESIVDAGVVPTLGGVQYRVTHIDAQDHESPPAYGLWLYPPAPASDEICVIVFVIGEDFGISSQENVTIYGELTSDDQYSVPSGQHLDQAAGANTQITNALGLTFFQCRKTKVRAAKGGGAATPYKFTVNTTRGSLTVYVDEVPDRDWVRWCDVAR